MRATIRQSEVTKLKHEILTHGESYSFVRDKLDEYQEPTGEQENVATISGLFHVSKGYLTRTVNDANVTHSKGQPMLMALYDDSSSLIKMNDIVTINGKRFKVTGKNNVGEYNIVLDLSLEMMLDGDSI